MTDPKRLALEVAEELDRAIENYSPGADNVQIKTVNAHPDHFEILDYRATLPDGSTVHKQRIIIQR